MTVPTPCPTRCTTRTLVPAYERALRHIDKTPTCWIWTGAKVGGYGAVRLGKTTVRAHRVIWEAVNGPVPEGKELGHRCPEGARKDCVNPAHIEAITHAENTNDYYGGWCRRRLHRLDDPANVAYDGPGRRRCRPCTTAAQRERERVAKESGTWAAPRDGTCPRGHEYMPDNLSRQYGRRCKQCHREQERARVARLRAAA